MIIENVRPGDVASLISVLGILLAVAFLLGWFAERMWRVIRLSVWLLWLEFAALREKRFFHRFARRQQNRGGIRP
jgi:hypothetical protein